MIGRSFPTLLVLLSLGLRSITAETVWSDWGQCDAQTGIQVKTATRPCRVDGGWSAWQQQGECKVENCYATEGRAIASRTCNNPLPLNGGSECQGRRYRYITCTDIPPCPVPGGWCEWSDWTPCPTCLEFRQENIFQYRNRTCECPPPQHGGSCRFDNGWDTDQLECSDLSRCQLEYEPGQTLGPEDWSETTPTPTSSSTLGEIIDWDNLDL